MSDCSLFINPAIKSFWVENPIWNLDKYKYSQIDIIQTSKGEIYFTQNCRSCKYSSWWMSKILSSLKSFTISLLWQFGKRHNVCGQRILMFKYFETQYWNFPGSLAAWVLVLGPQAGNDVRWGQWRCGHGPTYNLHTGHTQVLAVSVLPSPVWTKDSDEAMLCCAAEVSRTCAMCGIVGCCDAHLDPDPAPLLLLITEPALHPDLCSRNVHI